MIQQDWELKKRLFGTALIAVITILCYWPAINSDFIWDDDSYVTRNQTLRDAEGLRRIWVDPGATPQYYPLTFTVFWAQYQMWGLNPSGYHLVNIILHVCNAVLIWLILKRLKIISAFLISLLFALHPVCVESVAWITELKNVQSFFFYLLSLYMYLVFNPLDKSGEQRRPWRFYGFSFFFFLCALLSKTVVSSLPVAVLIIYWWKRGKVSVRECLLLIPYFLSGLGMGLMTIWIEQHHVGADWNFSFIERCLIAGHAVLFYAVKVVLPFNLTFIYPRWEISAAKVLQYVYPLLFLFLLIYLVRKRREIGRGALAAVLYFTVTLFPALGFIDVYPMKFSFVADHFQYMAMVSLLILIVEGVRKRFVRYFLFTPINRNRVCFFVLGTFAVTTFLQTRMYKNEETIYLSTISRNPKCEMCYLNLDKVYTEQNRVEEMEKRYLLAVENIPDFYEAYYNLAAIYLKLNKPQAAEGYYKKVLMGNVDFPRTHYNLGLAFEKQLRAHEAIQLFKVHVKENPNDSRGYQKLGANFSKIHLYHQAVNSYRQALSLNPRDAENWYNLGVLYLKMKRYQEAVEHNQQAVYFNPEFIQAYYNLGFAYEQLGERQRAVELYKKVLELDPDSRKARQQIQLLTEGG